MAQKIITLDKGNTVDIVAPSSKGAPINDITKYVLESLDLKPRIPEDIYSNDDIFYSNTNECRAKLFKEALLSKDSKAIWSIRGGKGAIEILPYLEGKVQGFAGLPDFLPHTKLLIGFSDITALHLYLQYKYGFPTIHAPMLEQMMLLEITEESIDEIIDLVFGKIDKLSYPLTPIGPNHNAAEKIEGKLTGGNLSLVAAGTGTVWQMNPKDKIIFLEDVNGAAYQVERYLDSLLQAHAFDEAKAIILCDFIKMADDDLIPKVRERFAEKVDIPVFHLKGVGHDEVNHPMIYGIDYSISDSYLTTSLF